MKVDLQISRTRHAHFEGPPTPVLIGLGMVLLTLAAVGIALSVAFYTGALTSKVSKTSDVVAALLGE